MYINKNIVNNLYRAYIHSLIRAFLICTMAFMCKLAEFNFIQLFKSKDNIPTPCSALFNIPVGILAPSLLLVQSIEIDQ